MKLTVVMMMVLAASLSLPVFGNGQVDAPEQALETATTQAAAEQIKSPAARLSYAFGLDIGRSLQRMETELDLDALLLGIKTSLDGKTPLLTAEQMSEIKKEFFAKKKEERGRQRKESVEMNVKQGQEFLAANKKKEGVVTTDSGLQYVVLTEGDGEKPQATDRVTVHYRGTLIDGTEFDSSHKRDQPATFAVKGVIAGWTEALQLMKVGSKYKLFIPPDLAYGPRGSGRLIGPNATLIFEVELLEIAK